MIPWTESRQALPDYIIIAGGSLSLKFACRNLRATDIIACIKEMMENEQ